MSKRTKKVEDYSLDRKITDALISWLDNSRKKPIETIRTFDDFVKAFGIPKENNISLRPGQVSDSLREGLVKYTHEAFIQQTEHDGLNNFFDALYYAFPVAFSNNGETLATLRRRALGEDINVDLTKDKNRDSYREVLEMLKPENVKLSEMAKVVDGRKTVDSTDFLRFLIHANKMHRYMELHQADLEAYNDFERALTESKQANHVVHSDGKVQQIKDFFENRLNYKKNPNYVENSDNGQRKWISKVERQPNDQLMKKLYRMGFNTKKIAGVLFDASVLNENGTLNSNSADIPNTEHDEVSAHEAVKSVDAITSAFMVKFALDELGLETDEKKRFNKNKFNELSNEDQDLIIKFMCRNGHDIDKDTFPMIIRRAHLVDDYINSMKDSKIIAGDINDFKRTVLNASINSGAFSKESDVEFWFAMAEAFADKEVTNSPYVNKDEIYGVQLDKEGRPVKYDSKHKDLVPYVDANGKTIMEEAKKVRRYISSGVLSINGKSYIVPGLPVMPEYKSEGIKGDSWQLAISDFELNELKTKLSDQMGYSMGDITRENITIGLNEMAFDCIDKAEELFAEQVENRKKNVNVGQEKHEDEVPYFNKDEVLFHISDFSHFKDNKRYLEIRKLMSGEARNMTSILEVCEQYEQAKRQLEDAYQGKYNIRRNVARKQTNEMNKTKEVSENEKIREEEAEAIRLDEENATKPDEVLQNHSTAENIFNAVNADTEINLDNVVVEPAEKSGDDETVKQEVVDAKVEEAETPAEEINVTTEKAEEIAQEESIVKPVIKSTERVYKFCFSLHNDVDIYEVEEKGKTRYETMTLDKTGDELVEGRITKRKYKRLARQFESEQKRKEAEAEEAQVKEEKEQPDLDFGN